MKRIIGGVLLIAVGIVAAVMWLNTGLMLIGLFAVGVPAGIALLWNTLKSNPISFIGLRNLKPVSKKEPEVNSFTFYAKKLDENKLKADSLKVEYINSPEGVPFKSRRWKGVSYYINIFDPVNRKMMPVSDILTDTKYHDPRALIKAAYLPANTELAKKTDDEKYKISAWLLVVVIFIEFLALVIIP
jgi:hypothetical protein